MWVILFVPRTVARGLLRLVNNITKILLNSFCLFVTLQDFIHVIKSKTLYTALHESKFHLTVFERSLMSSQTQNPYPNTKP